MHFQMAKYWKTRPKAQLPTTEEWIEVPTPSTLDSNTKISDFDRLRQTLIMEDDSGWEEELHSYLKAIPSDVTKETDIIQWWSVSTLLGIYLYLTPASATTTRLSDTRPNRT